jgi:Amt family ammonium transporter
LSQIAKDESNLSFSAKVSRLAVRLRDPQWRRYGELLLAGKMLGVALVFCIMLGIPSLIAVAPEVLGGTAYAGDEVQSSAESEQSATTTAAAPTAADIVNPLNTVWVLVAAFLVFGMQVGFTMLEAGFCRSRETVNVLVECVFDTCLCGILFYAFGFAFMFGHGNGWIGWGDGTGNNWFFLQNTPATYEATGVAFLAIWIFQFAFADTCSTITSGAMIGRTAFIGDILYSCCVTGFIYPVIGHWAWGPDGFLATMGSAGNFYAELGTGFHDFAGSTVVHTIGGMISLAGAIVLGPRLGRKFKRDGGGPMLPHDLTIAVAGGLLLWFGWYGFNPGSTLSAMDMVGISRVATNTTLAACAGGITAVFYGYVKWSKKWDASAITNGFLAGLVAVTCPCYWVSPTGAVILGAIAGVIVMVAVEVLEWLRIDDPIGAVPVHGFCGIWGTLSLGLFASGEFGVTGPTGPDNSTGAVLTGLFYGGGTQVLVAQAIGSACVTVATLVVSFVVMFVINAIGMLRLSKEQEAHGMDLSEHGVSAYPEYQVASWAAPSGMSPHNS